ncbi:MAG: hypothetical protein HY649_02985 [Acidobacteria bacterium]|nr:hypothetical protein [Acidobacteriota bacterium]
MSWVKQFCLSIGLACLLSAFGAAPYLVGQNQGSSQPWPERLSWENWFYGQRIQGLGYIPEDALAKAVAERDGLLRSVKYSTQSLQTRAVTSGQWLPWGPAPLNSVLNDYVSGRVTSLAIDPRNPATVYLAAAGGGVWKSVNRGLQWTPLTDRLASLASGAVAVDPFSGEVWYGTGELNFCRDCYYGAGVYRSADGGSSWTRVNPANFLSSPTSLIVFDERNQGTVFIGRSTALWKSSDGGQTWRAVMRGAVTDFLYHPVDSSIAYAAIGNFSGSEENGVYRSTDGGETWTRLEGGLPVQATMGRIALAIAPTAPNTVYALIVRSSDFNLNGLYRSLDGGNTWVRLNTLPENIFLEDGAGQGLFNLLVKVDPTDDGVVYVGGVDLWKSTNHGATWQNLSLRAGLRPGLHEDQRNIVFDTSDRRTFYLIGDSGVWRSSDGGNSFTNLNHSLSITQFQTVTLHATDPSQAVGGTQDNGTALYRGSLAWDQARPGDSGVAFYDPFQSETIYTVARRFSLRRSDDGGRSFLQISEGLNTSDRVLFYPPLVAHPEIGGMLYFASHRIWLSRDRGDHWTPVSGDLTGGGAAAISTLVVAPSSPQVLYAGTSDGRVQVSTSGGFNWLATAPLPDRFVTSVAVHPQLPEWAWVGLSGFGTGHVFRTTDQGQSWQDMSRNLPDVPVNALLVDAASPQTVYAGTDIGVFVFTELGSWEPLQEGLPNAVVLGLSQNPVTGLLVAATHGRGVFAMLLGEPARSAPRIDVALNAAGFQHGPMAPGMTVALFGANLASDLVRPTQPFPLPASLGGTTVFVNDIAAPLFVVSPSQVNFLVPNAVQGPVAQVTVRNGAGQAAIRVPWSNSSPGIYHSDGQSSIFHSSGAPVTASLPALRGEALVLYASGLGPVLPPVADGFPGSASILSRTVEQPVVSVGGLPAQVQFAGLTPGWPGLYQVNLVVPTEVSGSLAVEINMSGVTSNTGILHVAP